jgi:RNA recognition motif-containing protein
VPTLCALAIAMEDKEKDQRTVFVRGVSFATDEKELEDAFTDIGPVRSCFLVRSKGETKHKGFGFVQFAIAQDADRAVQELDGKVVAGRKLQVRAPSPRGRSAAGFAMLPHGDALSLALMAAQLSVHVASLHKTRTCSPRRHPSPSKPTPPAAARRSRAPSSARLLSSARSASCSRATQQTATQQQQQQQQPPGRQPPPLRLPPPRSLSPQNPSPGPLQRLRPTTTQQAAARSSRRSTRACAPWPSAT